LVKHIVVRYIPGGRHLSPGIPGACRIPVPDPLLPALQRRGGKAARRGATAASGHAGGESKGAGTGQHSLFGGAVTASPSQCGGAGGPAGSIRVRAQSTSGE